MWVLDPLLRGLVVAGELNVVDPRGRVHRYCGEDDGAAVTVRIHEPGLLPKLWLQPSVALGEAYMDGALSIEEGSLEAFVELCLRGARPVSAASPLRTGWLSRLLSRSRTNSVLRARRQAAHHYDLSDALFARFLDADRQYSCAYFAEPDMDLDQAQEAKKRLLASKLRLADGHRVLDIGSGWGGLALHLARQADVHVTGITLSQRQLEVSRRRAQEAGLSDRVRFELKDYRQLERRYDRVVSVGMFEHVGARHYDELFRKLREMLTEDGVAIIHSIGRAEPPRSIDAWMGKYIFPGAHIPALSEVGKYIFPGAHIPALSEVLPPIERAGLWTTDLEILRLHYAETLRHWHRRFQARRHEIAELYDERFCRMWEFYLSAAEAGFRAGPLMVFQAQLARRVDAVPLTRDYLLGTGRPPASELGSRAA